MKYFQRFVVLFIFGLIFIQCSKSKISNFTELSERIAPKQTQAFALFDFEKEPTLERMRDQYFKIFLESPELMKLLPAPLNKELMTKILSPKKFSIFLWPKGNNTSIMPKGKVGDDIPFQVLAVMKMKDASGIKSFLDENLIQLAQKKFKTEYVKGKKGDVVIYRPKDTKKPGLQIAIYKDYALLAVELDSLVTGIDRLIDPKKGIGDNVNYKNDKQKYFQDSLLFGYVNLSALIGKPDSLKTMPSVQKAVEAIQSLIFSASKKEGYLIVDYKIVIDPLKGGQVLQKFLQPKNNFSLESLKMMVKDHDYYMAINLKMLWNMIYNAMGEIPEYAKIRNIPETKLNAMNLNLQKDFMDVITGEIAVSGNYMKFMAGYMNAFSKVLKTPVQNQSSQTPPSTASSPPPLPQTPDSIYGSLINSFGSSVLLVGVKDQEKMDALLTRLAGPYLANQVTSDIEGVSFRCVPDKFCLGYYNNYLIVAAGTKGAASYIKQIKSGAIYKPTEAYKLIMGQDDKQLVISYFDIDWNSPAMKIIIERFNQPGAVKNPLAYNPSSLMTDFYKSFGEMWYLMGLENDGILLRSVFKLR